ncbi:uncharacterized protein [Littorina saxatilis]|uniref:uncharacterized protein n=1 Tax=Littorina saxatilis TaxID=31220 RepID=UPI0038B62A81
MEGLFRTVSTAITDRFYSFFSLTSASLPEDEYDSDDEDYDVSSDSDSDWDLDDELQTRLGSVYGAATPTACAQAREVLVKHFSGDVGRFLTHFLTPSLDLLDDIRRQVRQVSQQTAWSPTVVATRGSKGG